MRIKSWIFLEKYLSQDVHISLVWSRVVGVSEVEERSAGGKAKAKNRRRGAGGRKPKGSNFQSLVSKTRG